MSSTATANSDRAAEVTRQWPGWRVWTTDQGSPVATRTGRQKEPANNGVWARTLICDDWSQLEVKLAEQTANDAALA